jgi:hypothetical protein
MLFENIFREMEATIKKSKAFSKITRHFKDIFNGIEFFLSVVRLFQRIRCFFKSFPDK